MRSPCEATSTLLPDQGPAHLAGKPMPFRPSEPTALNATEERQSAEQKSERWPRYRFRAL